MRPNDDFLHGFVCALEEVAKNDVDIDEALYGFMIDPPDSDHQRGYLEVFKQLKAGKRPHVQDGNVIYVNF